MERRLPSNGSSRCNKCRVGMSLVPKIPKSMSTFSLVYVIQYFFLFILFIYL
ncbi:hypothetical protein Hdeb2414_s0014g00435561 [Helianthus debilis subsp. tardiflorus]